jgi:hypothetical protein
MLKQNKIHRRIESNPSCSLFLPTGEKKNVQHRFISPSIYTPQNMTFGSLSLIVLAAIFRSFCRKKGRGRTPGIERDCNRLLVLDRRRIHFRLPGPTVQRRSSTRTGRATQAAAPVSAAGTAAASGLEPLPRAPR